MSTKAASLERLLLAIPQGRASARRSALNNDGTPLQRCYAAGRHGVHLRAIADPATHLEDSEQRYQAALEALSKAMEATDATDLGPLFERTIAHFGPSHERPHKQFTHGVFWIVCGMDGRGCGIYVDAQQSRETMWPHLEEWLCELGVRDRALVRRIAQNGALMSAGIEGASASDARAKFYWRLDDVKPLDEIGVPLLDDPAFSRFARAVVADHRMRTSAVVLSVGFSCNDGTFCDVKLDLCTCPGCARHEYAAWSALLDELSDAFEIARMPDDMLAHGSMAFVGFGLDVSGSRRLHTYLNPAEASAAW